MSVLDFLNWSIVGLVYDIAGAVALALALFLNSAVKIARQGETYMTGNPYTMHALAEQTVDARLGLTLLVAGFVFQAFGQWWNDAYLSWHLVALVALPLICLSFAAFRGRLVAKLEAKSIQSMKAERVKRKEAHG